MNTIKIVDDWHEEITSWRHHLHSTPEVGFALHKTSAYLAEKLKSWNIETDLQFGQTGVVGVIDGDLGEGRTIAYRCDMDALPMVDHTGKSYASKNEGCAHSCGHDGHMAIGLATARYLSMHRNFKGRVIFLFQPAEEIGAGAKAMMDDGLFQHYPFDEVYGFHNMPRFEENQILLRHGPITGAAEIFILKVKGCSGHSSVPYKCKNPINIAAKIITQWQSISAEYIPSSDMCVLAVTKFKSGEVFNAIPESAEAGGTIRFYEPDVGALMRRKMKQIATSIAESCDATATVDFTVLCPATINTAEQVDCVIKVANDTVGNNFLNTNVDASPGGEDMAFFIDRKETGGCYFMIGSKGTNLHTSDFDFDDSIIPLGVTMLCRIAEQRLV